MRSARVLASCIVRVNPPPQVIVNEEVIVIGDAMLGRVKTKH